MSKQSEAKAMQGYNPKPTPSACANCAHFESDMVQTRYCIVEKNRHCTLGGFVVNKTATCFKFRPK